MKRMRKNYFLLATSCCLAFAMTVISCSKKNDRASEYAKKIEEVAAKYQAKCPVKEANGTTLESVSFKDNTMLFRLTLSDEAIVTINLDNTRDSIIREMSDKLKQYFVKGNCKLEYRYVAPDDSSSITIVPNELQQSISKDNK